MKAITFALCGILVCNSMLFQDAPKKLDDQDDDYAVYSEVIGQKYVREGVDRIVIREHTFKSDQPRPTTGNAEYGKEFYDAVANETRLDYDQKNKSPMVFDQNRFSLKKSVAMISVAEYDRIFSAGLDMKAGNGKLVKGPSRLLKKSEIM